MEKIISKFWQGKITLWRSYWLVGELSNAVFILIIFNLEIYLFGNNQFTSSLPFLDFSNFSLLSKLVLILWTIFLTIGIWRSAENYKGPFWIIALTLLYIGFNNLTILYFVIINLFK